MFQLSYGVFVLPSGVLHNLRFMRRLEIVEY